MTPEKWLNRVDPLSFRRKLFRWYKRCGRDFAWRRSEDLYAVWVSEVMLQQTTTTTVSRRFPQFLQQFPTIEMLAEASEASVLRAWEGLGYYRRARNLHRAARIVASEYHGEVPHDPTVLRSLPGLGRYSANAILSFARNAPLPILEANTVRVWSRLCGVKGDPAKQPIRGELWNVAESLIPKRRGRDFNLALMDLGALVCTPRSPDCPRCPVNEYCLAFRSGRPERFPLKAARPTTIDERHVAIVLRRRGGYLVRQRGDRGRWAGMWEFPNVQVADGEDAEAAALALASTYAEPRGTAVRLPAVRHGIMHFRIELKPFLIEVAKARPAAATSVRWVLEKELTDLPLSTAHRRIARSLPSAPVGESLRPGRRT